MIQVLPKWRVVFDFANESPLTIYISDFYAANVLRKAAEIDFGMSKTIRSITVTLEQVQPPTGITQASFTGKG
jgi:hypothetical protein